MVTARARHILVNTEEECNRLIEELKDGADFTELAKAHSGCPSKAQGGDLGEFGEGQMVKEFNDVVFTADIGEVVGPVQTQFGYHIIEVTQRA
jgi:peptidyl-prolyl cis-trans isomerase C